MPTRIPYTTMVSERVLGNSDPAQASHDPGRGSAASPGLAEPSLRAAVLVGAAFAHLSCAADGVDRDADSAVRALDRPIVVWQSSQLDRPTHVVATASLIAVADRTHIHVMTRGGGAVSSIGREGRGPGEFVRIEGLGTWAADTLAVWDGALMRLTLLTTDGTVARTLAVDAPAEFGAPRRVRLTRVGQNVVLAWAEGVIRTDGAPTEEVLWLHNTTDATGRELARLPSTPLVAAGPGLAVPQTLFGPRPLHAVSAERGLAAIATGEDGCIVFIDVVTADRNELCQDWPAVPTGPSHRSPPRSELDRLSGFGERQRQLLDARLAVQTTPPNQHAIESMLFDMNGRLWLHRITGEIRFDSMLRGQYAELRPALYRWEILDPATGSVHAVSLDSRLTPMFITNDEIWGVYETLNGEPAIARVPF